MNISTAADIRQKVEAKRYGYFTFPVLDINVKYRKPDVLKLALNNSLPTALAEQIIKAYKANLEGQQDKFREELTKNKIEADDKLLSEIRDRGYILLKDLVVSHRILDVPESDFDNDVISWNDVPEEDAIAFIFFLISSAETAQTTNGGEVSAKDIETFPNRKRQSKRATAR